MSNINDFVIENGVLTKYAGNSAHVEIPDTVKWIKRDSFRDCTTLESVIIPNSVKGIEVAFCGCTNLKSITIPASVYSFDGWWQFSQCQKLESIVVEEGNNLYRSANNCIIEITTQTLIFGCKTSVIPDDGSIKKIGKKAFYKCLGPETIVIPKSVKRIDDDAFYGCENLKSITVPKSVTNISRSAFYECKNLVAITEPGSYAEMFFDGFIMEGRVLVRYVGKSAHVKIPAKTKKIAHDAFSNKNIESVVIPEAVTQIERGAFSDCKNLKSIIIPNSITQIEESTFSGCESLENIHIPASVTLIEKYAFNCSKSLEHITVDENNTVYRSKDNCLIETASKTLVLGSKNGVIPDDGSVTSIQATAFHHITNLKSIHIPATITNMDGRPFFGCTGIESITVDEGNKVFHSINNCLIKDHALLLGCNNSTIPNDDSIWFIDNYAFKDCTDIKSITIPDSVVSIENYAFNNCASIEHVTIPASVAKIGDGAFKGCTSLESVTFDSDPKSCSSPYAIKDIRSDIFMGCEKLKSVTLPHWLSSIPQHMFGGCKSLENITLPDAVTCICSYAFRDCKTLKNITLPTSTEYLYDYAIIGCDNLESITIPASVKRIDRGAICVGDKVKIITTAGSKAEIYAREKGIPFELI